MKILPVLAMVALACGISASAQAGCDKKAIRSLAKDLAYSAEDLADIVDDYDYRHLRDLEKDAKDLEDEALELADAASDRKSCGKLEKKYRHARYAFEEVYDEVIEALVDSHARVGSTAVITGGYRVTTIGGRTTVSGPVGGNDGRRPYDFHSNFEIVVALDQVMAIFNDLRYIFEN